MEVLEHDSMIDIEMNLPSSGGTTFDLRASFPTIPSTSSGNITSGRRKLGDRQP